MKNDYGKIIQNINGFTIKDLKQIQENNNEINYKLLSKMNEANQQKNFFFLPSIIGLDIKVTNDYPDVPKEYWAYEFILWAHNNGIVFGYPDGYFRPDKWVKQGEFLAVLIRYQHITLRGRIVKEHWTEPYYELAIKEKWIKPEKSNLIYRNSPITFHEAAMIICQAFHLDVKSNRPLETLVSLEVVPDNTNVGKQLTRAELVKLFYQLSISPEIRRKKDV